MSTGLAEQAASSYHILEQSNGTRWLFLALSWLPVNYQSSADTDYSGMSPQTLAWSKGVLEANRGTSSWIIAHTMISNDCADGDWTAYEDTWCGNWSGWSNFWTGMTVYDELDYPWVGFHVGGHIRSLFVRISAWKTHPILAAAVDYTDPITGAPSWQTDLDPEWNRPTNGGGGLVQMIRVDPSRNRVSSKACSDYQAAWLDVQGDEGSNWAVNLPVCSAPTQLDFPPGGSPERPLPASIELLEGDDDVGEDTAVLAAIHELRTDLAHDNRESRGQIDVVHGRISELAKQASRFREDTKERTAVLARIELACPITEVQQAVVKAEAAENGRRKESARISALVAGAVGVLGLVLSVAAARGIGGSS